MTRPTSWAAVLLYLLLPANGCTSAARAPSPRTTPAAANRPHAHLLAARAAASVPEQPGDEEGETPSAEYIEYRFLPELGQIVINDGIVRGERSVARLEAGAAELANRGIFACTDAEKPHLYRRSDTLDGRKVETLILITPPADEVSDWTRHVVVRVDGRKKVDCSIGYSPDELVLVSGLTIYPEEGTVELSAFDADGGILLPPDEFLDLDHKGVITDDTLQPPDDADSAPERPKTEKV